MIDEPTAAELNHQQAPEQLATEQLDLETDTAVAAVLTIRRLMLVGAAAVACAVTWWGSLCGSLRGSLCGTTRRLRLVQRCGCGHVPPVAVTCYGATLSSGVVLGTSPPVVR